MKRACIQVYFLTTGKRRTYFLSIKKESRQLKKNCQYRYYGKTFEKVIFDTMYRHFTDNKLLTPNQSGFRPVHSTVNQLLYITHQTYTALEDFPSHETRAVFTNISRAFDKVWHKGLVFKLKTYDISGPLAWP